MNSKTTKAKRKAIPCLTLAEVDRRDGVERFDHLMDPLDKWLAAEQASSGYIKRVPECARAI